jgi:hypothetical protein
LLIHGFARCGRAWRVPRRDARNLKS